MNFQPSFFGFGLTLIIKTRHGDSEDPEWIHELTKDELIFNAAVQVLSDYGLVDVDMSS